jgi:hypothetical protein
MVADRWSLLSHFVFIVIENDSGRHVHHDIINYILEIFELHFAERVFENKLFWIYARPC